MNPTINLYCEDCLPAMKKMADNQYDLAIVDPPYGIKDWNKRGSNRKLYAGNNYQKLKEWDIELGDIELVPLMSYHDYIGAIYSSKFIISDSGTAQEEPCLFGRPVIVPRDFTERPESVINNCSIMIDVNTIDNQSWDDAEAYIQDIWNGVISMNKRWLGTGETSKLIVDKIKELYKCS